MSGESKGSPRTCRRSVKLARRLLRPAAARFLGAGAGHVRSRAAVAGLRATARSPVCPRRTARGGRRRACHSCHASGGVLYVALRFIGAAREGFTHLVVDLFPRLLALIRP